MPLDQILLAILGILVLVNVVLIASIPLRTRRRRRSLQQGPGAPRTAEDARAAEAIEAFVSQVSADAAGGVHPLAATDLPEPDTVERPATPAPESDREFGDAALWARTVREESARVARFGHPVTVVMAELPHLDAIGDRFGRGVVDQITTETERRIVTESRSADRIARLGDARFGILLLETEEARARDYIDRVRAAADAWLESAGLSIRLSLGWASPGQGGDIVAAAALAEQRMHDADRAASPG